MAAELSTRPWEVQESSFPTDGTLLEQGQFLVRYAILAPSTHNSQPWEFSVDDGTLYVYADESRWLDVADVDKRELYFSVGCAIENFIVAARHFGFDTSIEYEPHEMPDAVASVVFWRDEEAELSTERFAAITQRRTNHNVYHDQPVSDEVLARLRECVREDDIDLLLMDDDATQVVATFQTQADRRQFDDPTYRYELGRWIRSGALGETWLTARIGQLAVTHLDLGQQEAKKNSRLIRSAPELAAITTTSNDRALQVDAGRAFERLFLTATNLGLAVHPMNQILQIPDLKAELADLIDVTDRSLQLLFRLGYAPPEESRRPRRPVEDVLRE